MPQSIVSFVVLLGVLITVHELGHFLIAKALNVKVLRFSIGFGPKIVGFTRGETEYRIAWLPLGGYVKMAGELPYDELAPEDASRGFLAQPPWKRALIVVGGPLFNLVFPILIYFFFFIQPQQLPSTQVRYVQNESPAATAGIRPGDRITAVNGEAVTTFDGLSKRIGDLAGQPTHLTVQRDGKTFDVDVTPAQAFEVGQLESNVRGSLGIDPNAPLPVLGVEPDSPAFAAGLRTSDLVLAVNGKPVSDVYAMTEALKGAPNPVTVKVLRNESLGLPGIPMTNPKVLTFQVPVVQDAFGFAALGAEPPDLFLSTVYPGSPAYQAGLRVGDRLVAVNGTPLPSFGAFQSAVARAKGQPFQLEWRHEGQPQKASLQVGKFDISIAGQKIPTQAVGVGSSLMVNSRTTETVTVHLGVLGSLRASVERVGENIRSVGLVLAKLVTRELPFNTVGGPIMMFQLAGEASQMGLEHFLGLMGFISVNLGIMNLLPIPVLDGFALLSAIWEGVRRRPIPTRAREIANMVGLAMLVVLMVAVMFNDITR